MDLFLTFSFEIMITSIIIIAMAKFKATHPNKICKFRLAAEIRNQIAIEASTIPRSRQVKTSFLV
jgi:hypothetical protein